MRLGKGDVAHYKPFRPYCERHGDRRAPLEFRRLAVEQCEVMAFAAPAPSHRESNAKP